MTSPSSSISTAPGADRVIGRRNARVLGPDQAAPGGRVRARQAWSGCSSAVRRSSQPDRVLAHQSTDSCSVDHTRTTIVVPSAATGALMGSDRGENGACALICAGSATSG